MKFSIIIPVYNSEKYIKRCLDSIISQNCDDIEIIVINDGSTDSTMEILKEYKKNHLKIYSIENSGVSSARNYGLSLAKGDFIVFVDSDDFLADNFFDEIRKIDLQFGNIYVFNYQVLNNNIIKNKVSSNQIVEISKEDAIEYSIKSNSNPYKRTRFNTVWGKIYDKKLLNNVKFDGKITIGEDTLFFCEAALVSEKVIYVDKLMYYYFNNNNSLTHSYNEKMLINEIYWHKKLEKLFDKFNIKNKHKLIKYTKLKGLLNVIILYVLTNPIQSIQKKRMRIKELLTEQHYRGINIDAKILKEFNFKDKCILVLLKLKLYYFIVILYSFKKMNFKNKEKNP